MESAEGVKIDERAHALKQWLRKEVGLNEVALQPMQGDASFRRYFRVQSFVAMDAPPPRENCASFVAIARALRTLGLKTPEIIEQDIERGFLLLTDFGDYTYLRTLNQQNANVLYQRALRALATMHQCREVPFYTLPLFTAEFMQQEWQWHQEWFLKKYLGLECDHVELDKCYHLLVQSAVEQPQVFMHRDYHSANLMMLPDDVGILDFQDAFIGPLTYDLVSLLRDCYIDWPHEMVETWALFYFSLLQQRGELQKISKEKFLRWFDLMGLQRHLKALMTFARKKVRDSQPQYLEHIPRTINYIVDVSGRYSELAPLHQYYKKVQQLCAQ